MVSTRVYGDADAVADADPGDSVELWP